MTKRILFACFDQGDSPTIASIIPLLQKSGHSVGVAGTYKNYRIAEKLGDVELFLPPESEQAPGTSLNSPDGFKSFLYTMLNVKGIGKLFAPELFVSSLYEELKDSKIAQYHSSYPTFIERCLQDFSPDLTVICPGNGEAFHAIGACRKLKLKYCFLLPQYYEFKSLSPFIIHQDGAPYIVSSNYGRERLLALGLSDEKIIVTGNPRLERAFQLAKTKSRLAPPIAHPRQSKRILYAMQGLHNNSPLLSYLVQYVTSRQDVELYLRPHPTTTELDLVTVKKFSDQKIKLDTTEHSSLSLLSSDVLVTLTSMTTLEALILNIPTILVKTNFLPDEIPFANDGNALGATNSTELANGLDKFLFDESYRRSWLEKHKDSYKRYSGIFEENASGGLADTIEKLVTVL